MGVLSLQVPTRVAPAATLEFIRASEVSMVTPAQSWGNVQVLSVAWV